MSKTATKGTQANASKKLAREKVLEAVFSLPPELRGEAKAMLNKPIADRQGSEKWHREHPSSTPVTKAQKVKMARQHQAGASFRALESIWHLIPNSGNGAQRCVNEGLEYIKQAEKAKGGSKRRKEAVAS